MTASALTDRSPRVFAEHQLDLCVKDSCVPIIAGNCCYLYSLSMYTPVLVLPVAMVFLHLALVPACQALDILGEAV